MNPILFDLGFIKIYWYSVMILLGVFFAYIFIMAEAKRFGINKDFMFNLIFYIVLFSIIGARLYYVLFNLPYYTSHPVEIFKVWEGGLAIHGGIILGLIWIIIYTKKYKVSTFRILDIIVVGLLLGQAIGRWGNFFNGEAHGAVTTLNHLQSLHIPEFIIKGMQINGVYYQPTFLYESLWCLIGFILILIIRRLRYIKVGQITSFYLVWYGIGRFIIEAMRTDSLMFFGLKQAQIISVFMVVIGIVIFVVKNKGSKLDNRYNDRSNINEIRF